jgi:hypothetical protein
MEEASSEFGQLGLVYFGGKFLEGFWVLFSAYYK